MSVNIKCVDLFCGCGGMSLGFQKAGFNIVAGIDNWKSAIRVYGMNFNHPIIEQDLLVYFFRYPLSYWIPEDFPHLDVFLPSTFPHD